MNYRRKLSSVAEEWYDEERAILADSVCCVYFVGWDDGLLNVRNGDLHTTDTWSAMLTAEKCRSPRLIVGNNSAAISIPLGMGWRVLMLMDRSGRHNSFLCL